MVSKHASLNKFVAALLAAGLFAGAVPAQPAEDDAPPVVLPEVPSAEAPTVERLLQQLAKPEQPGWQQIENSIVREWAKSGSPAMDLLLQRGQAALEAGDMQAAIEHLTALTDHAPDFAEGWNARATAFFHAGELGLSVADIERTLALNPQHFGALTGLAIILEELEYEQDALEAYRAVAAIHPHRTEVQDAIERLEKAVEGQAL